MKSYVIEKFPVEPLRYFEGFKKVQDGTSRMVEYWTTCIIGAQHFESFEEAADYVSKRHLSVDKLSIVEVSISTKKLSNVSVK